MPWDPGDNGWWQGLGSHALPDALACRGSVSGVSRADAHKMQYAIDAATWMPDPFTNHTLLESPLFKVKPLRCARCTTAVCTVKALLWQAGKSAQEIIDFREEMVSQVELAAEELRLSGKLLQDSLQG